MKVLALSSSRVGGGGYLEEAKKYIESFLGSGTISIAFVPFASVQRDDEAYTQLVRDALTGLPYTIHTVEPTDAKAIIDQCDAIMIGGGNTFKLLHDIYTYSLLPLIQRKIKRGTPYIGWSAGANITGKTICTTNDMPIIQPQSFTALDFFPFQLNPHYINLVQKDFHGETRDQRLEEFVLLNAETPVVGLPEGTALWLADDKLHYKGNTEAVLFKNEAGVCTKTFITPQSDLSYML